MQDRASSSSEKEVSNTMTQNAPFVSSLSNVEVMQKSGGEEIMTEGTVCPEDDDTTSSLIESLPASSRVLTTDWSSMSEDAVVSPEVLVDTEDKLVLVESETTVSSWL